MLLHKCLCNEVLTFKLLLNTFVPLQELFTQTPVTKMINPISKSPKPQRIVIPASAENSISDMIGAHSDVTNQKLPTTFKPTFRTNMKPTYTAPVTTFHPKGNVQMTSSFNPKMTAHTISQYQPKATAQTFQTTAQFYPKVKPQSFSPFHPKTTLQTTSINALPTNIVSTYHPKTATYKVTPQLNVANSQSAATNANPKYSSRFSAATTHFTSTITPTVQMRPNVKHLLATIGLEPDNSSPPVQQSSTGFLPTTPQTVATYITTDATTTTTPTPELTPELKELLESFGLLTNEEPPAHVTAGPFQDEFLPIFPSSLKDETLSVSEFRPLPKSVTSSDIEEKIENSHEIKANDFSSFKPLPVPEVKPRATDEELETLLKTYGLLEEDERASKDIESEIEQLNDDSEESGSETFEVTVKPNKISHVPEVDVGFLTPDLAKVLGNIGVKNVYKPASQQSTRTTPTIMRRTDTSVPIQYTTGQVASSTMENDYQKLHLLLDTIKQLDSLNANLTEEELDKLNLKNFNLSKDTLVESEGPDPTEAFESSQQAKNEVKRQTNSSEPTRIQLDVTGTTPASGSTTDDDLDDDTKSNDEDETKSDDATEQTSKREGKNENLESDTESDTETDAEASSSSSTTSTTEEPRNGDLSGSFGGNDGLDPVSEEPLPPPRKNGFYFFSDWNSFLEVGEDPDKVVVRFDPKIGDPSQFVKVKTP